MVKAGPIPILGLTAYHNRKLFRASGIVNSDHVIPGVERNIDFTLNNLNLRSDEKIKSNIWENFNHFSVGHEGLTKDGKYVSFKHNLTTKNQSINFYDLSFFKELENYKSSPSVFSDQTISEKYGELQQYWHNQIVNFAIGSKRSVDWCTILESSRKKFRFNEENMKSILSNPNFTSLESIYKELFNHISNTNSDEVAQFCLDYFKVINFKQVDDSIIQLIDHTPFYDQAIQLGMEHLPIVTDISLLSIQ